MCEGLAVILFKIVQYWTETPSLVGIPSICSWSPIRVLILFLVGGLPNSGYHSYGYAPSGLAGAELITPNLPALVSIDQNRQAGTALGMRNSANSLGQTAGPALGGLLFCVGHEGGLFANGGDSGRRRDHHRLEGEGLQL